MTGRMSSHSGSGVHVPDGLGGYLDAGGIKVATRIHQGHDYTDAVNNARNRITLLAMAFLFCFVVLSGRLVMVTVLPGLLPKQSPTTVSEDTRLRGDIVDRHGHILATNLSSISLAADTREVWDVDETVAGILSVLPDLSEARLTRQLESGAHEIELARKITPRQKQDLFALGLPGLRFLRKDRRYYPRGRDASHVLGYVDVDNKGIAGVEKQLNAQIVEAGIKGETIDLSLDMRIQHILQDEIYKTVTKFNALSGSGVMMDVHTGEVIAIASLPDYDPNAPMDSPRDNRFNQVTKGTYELGSVFKMFTIAMALDHGTAGMTSGYDATKPLRIANFNISDYHGQKRWLTIPEIFMHSSNIGTVKVARDVGIPRHQDFLRKIGMFDQLDIEVPEVAIPDVPSFWREIRAATISYGHGIAVTPLHVATAAAAMVNGGRMVQPTLLRRGLDETVAAPQVISPATSRKMRDLLRMVVTDGTGGNAEVDGYFVGGKTGTAEKSRGGGYARRALISSFIATFPTYDPQYVIYVIINEPKGIKETYGYATAGWTAAPLTHNIIRRAAPLLGMVPKRDDEDVRQTNVSAQ